MSFKRLTALLVGMAVSALGLLSLAGYIFHRVGMYAWGGSGRPGMGLNTAIAFSLTGIGLMLIVLDGYKAEGNAGE